jgi:predicted amino acid racemase
LFLDVLRRRNADFLGAVAALHQDGRLPANTYALDLDAVQANAAVMAAAARRHSLEVFAMTKQMGNAPGFMRAVMAGGIGAGVAVDMRGARALRDGGMRLGHVGHLVQVPRAEATAAAALDPDNWTVFNDDKAAEAARASAAAGRVQDLIARIHAPGDVFYDGHAGGFPAADVVAVAKALGSHDGARFAGITTFPALLFDAETRDVRPTPNLATLARARERLQGVVDGLRVNAPGTTSSATFGLLGDHGATQVEPGHGLTGTTPLHAVRDLEELPAVCYVSEVSHLHGGWAYAFGGGLYIDPVFPDYPLRALVAERPDISEARVMTASIPPPSAIDYYAKLDLGDGPAPSIGATVVFGFRIQAFVARAYVAGIRGVAEGTPKVEGIWTAEGRPAPWPV